MKKILLVLLFFSVNIHGSSPMPVAGSIKDKKLEELFKDFKNVKVDPKFDNTWATGYQGKVIFTNTSGKSAKSWVVTFDLQPNQKISSLWDGVYTVNGNKVMVTPPAWHGSGDVDNGAEKSFGFIIQKPESAKEGILNVVAQVGTTEIDSGKRPAVLPAPVATPTPSSSSASGSPATKTVSKEVPVAKVASKSISKALKIPFVEGYWESWDYDIPLAEIANMKVDVIDVSFITFERKGKAIEVTGLSTEMERFTQFVQLSQKEGKKVKVALGGANYPLAQFFKSKDDVTAMAAALKKFVEDHGLDGIDFDIEDYASFLPKGMPELVTDLIRQLRTLLGDAALISFTPMAPAYAVEPYPTIMKAAHPYLSSISIMAYNAYPTYDYQDDVNRLIKMGIPAHKIVVGLMPGNDDTKVMTSLEKIRQASEFVKKQGLAGIMFWSLNRDHSTRGDKKTGLGADAATNAAWDIIHSR